MGLMPRLLSSGLICIGTLLYSQLSFSETRIFTSPESLLADQRFILHTVFEHESSCGHTLQQQISINNDQIEVRFSSSTESNCIENPVPGLATSFQEELGPLPKGVYNVLIYNTDDSIEKEFPLVIDQSGRHYVVFNHESPIEGQTVSGVGLIRGWACDRFTADHLLQYQIDNSSKVLIPHGSERGDTAERCWGLSPNEAFTGWGAVVNWNNYSPGEHKLSIWHNGRKVTEQNIIVANHSGAFLKNINKEFTVVNFPDGGDRTNLIWSQANQNFIISTTSNAK